MTQYNQDVSVSSSSNLTASRPARSAVSPRLLDTIQLLSKNKSILLTETFSREIEMREKLIGIHPLIDSTNQSFHKNYFRSPFCNTIQTPYYVFPGFARELKFKELISIKYFLTPTWS